MFVSTGFQLFLKISFRRQGITTIHGHFGHDNTKNLQQNSMCLILFTKIKDRLLALTEFDNHLKSNILDHSVIIMLEMLFGVRPAIVSYYVTPDA